MTALLSRAEAYMRTCMKDGDAAHDLSHIYRVTAYARDIAEHTPCDREVVMISALLHDIGRPAQDRDETLDHADVGARMAYAFLLPLTDEAFAIRVRDCIRTHRFRAGDQPATVEAQILYDADKLDVCGALGIARTLLYDGAHGIPLSTGSGWSFLQEYETKLAGLYDRFFTERARELAAPKRSAAEAFHQALLSELQTVSDSQRLLDELLRESNAKVV